MPATTAASSRLGAIAVICAGVVLLVINDSFSKWLVVRYEPLQILFMRSLMALPLVTALVLGLGGRRALVSSSVHVHAVRGLLAIGATHTFIYSLASLSLATATALTFTAPLFLALLSVPLLGEKIGWHRSISLVTGFVGVLVIVRPGTGTFQVASLLAVSAAVFYALMLIGARWIDRHERIWTMMFYMTLFAGIYSGIYTLFRPIPAIEPADLLLLAGSAVFGTMGITMISQAFRMAPASLIAPFDYTALVWAGLIGWLVWGSLPDIWTYVGAAAIIGAGVHLIVSESKTGT